MKTIKIRQKDMDEEIRGQIFKFTDPETNDLDYNSLMDSLIPEDASERLFWSMLDTVSDILQEMVDSGIYEQRRDNTRYPAVYWHRKIPASE